MSITEKYGKRRALVKRGQSSVKRNIFSLTQFADYFCTLKQNMLRETTLNHVYKPAIKNFLLTCGNRELASYSVRDVELFKAERLKDCSPVTVNIEFRTLKAAFNQAVKWEFMEENPFSKSSTVRVPEKPPVYFSREEFLKFLAEVQEPLLKDLFLFAVQTGLRKGEITSLQWSNIDLERKLVLVRNDFGFLTKTGKTRAVPMNESVFTMLSRMKNGNSDCPLVFHRDGKQLTQSYLSHKFKKSVRAAKLNDSLKFHSLRHTFATWLVQNSVSLFEVQKLLGHSDIKVTQVYAHLMTEELHATVNKISIL